MLKKDGRLHLLTDLGDGVLEAMVETGMYVFSRNAGRFFHSDFIRVLLPSDKGGVIKEVLDSMLAGHRDRRAFTIDPSKFAFLRHSPYAYWVSGSTVQVLGRAPQLEGNHGAVRVGLQTGDDHRFLRLLWEIPPSMLTLQPMEPGADTSEVRQNCINQLRGNCRWAPYSKTDSASPWFSPITLAVNWGNNGSEIKSFTDSKGKPRSVIRNESFYFNPGFSYMGRSTRLVPYLVPGGPIPTARRSQVYPHAGEEYGLLGICGSNVASAVARFSVKKFGWPNFQAGMIQSLPICDLTGEVSDQLEAHIDSEVNRRRSVIRRCEPYQEFTYPAWCDEQEDGDANWAIRCILGRRLELEIARSYGLSLEQLAELERDIDEAVSVRDRSRKGHDLDSEDESEATESVGWMAHTHEEMASELVSYCIGVVVGRWDVRMVLDRSLAPELPPPFEPMPICPPGSLVAPNGHFAASGRIVSEEWLCALLSSPYQVE